MSKLKELRRDAAKARSESWNLLSPKKQLAELDRRLGTNVGAKKQRARLAKALKGGADA